jgi:hypothetical protein
MAWTAPSGHVWAVGEVLTAANLNTYSANNLSFLYGDTSWTAPTFTNSWVNFGGGNNPAGFRLIGTRVVMRGVVSTGTIGLSAFTLPAGYRPPLAVNMPVVSNAAFGYVLINAVGTVIPSVGSNAWFSLESLTFDTI